MDGYHRAIGLAVAMAMAWLWPWPPCTTFSGDLSPLIYWTYDGRHLGQRFVLARSDADVHGSRELNRSPERLGEGKGGP